MFLVYFESRLVLVIGDVLLIVDRLSLVIDDVMLFVVVLCCCIVC